MGKKDKTQKYSNVNRLIQYADSDSKFKPRCNESVIICVHSNVDILDDNTTNTTVIPTNNHSEYKADVQNNDPNNDTTKQQYNNVELLYINNERNKYYYYIPRNWCSTVYDILNNSTNNLQQDDIKLIKQMNSYGSLVYRYNKQQNNQIEFLLVKQRYSRSFRSFICNIIQAYNINTNILQGNNWIISKKNNLYSMTKYELSIIQSISIDFFDNIDRLHQLNISRSWKYDNDYRSYKYFIQHYDIIKEYVDNLHFDINELENDHTMWLIPKGQREYNDYLYELSNSTICGQQYNTLQDRLHVVTAIRELCEEANINVDYNDLHLRLHSKPTRWSINFVFELLSDNIHNDKFDNNVESVERRWFTVDELPYKYIPTYMKNEIKSLNTQLTKFNNSKRQSTENLIDTDRKFIKQSKQHHTEQAQ